MAFRGERFVLDLDGSDGEEPTPSPFSLIGEIRERAPSAATPPAPAPPSTASSTGFPAHRKRSKVSSFKQRRTGQPDVPQERSPAVKTSPPSAQDDKQAIQEENRQHLASMSDSQIQQEREELMASLDPGLLERFLRRAKIDEDEQPIDTPKPEASQEQPATAKPKKSVSFDVPSSSIPPSPKPPAPVSMPQKATEAPRRPTNDDLAPKQTPTDLYPAAQPPSLDPAMIEKFHFPQPKQPMPILDPSSPSFLSDLQTHYFPEMAHDTRALSWLRDPSTDEEDPESASPYHPASEAISISPSAIRFSLRGTLLPPETSLSIPVTEGLHHHGDDPQAAGYTIPELAILSRSTFPAQRCVAWQILGRILFRLGRAEFGDRGGQLSEGLWFVIEKEGVVGGMLAEAEGATHLESASRSTPEKSQDEKSDENGMPMASGIGRHASAAAWAVEGVWLWQKGGGGDRGLLKEGQIRSQ